eukprot:Nk52_evm22s210 gene=Nk52_evmTU22s210
MLYLGRSSLRGFLFGVFLFMSCFLVFGSQGVQNGLNNEIDITNARLEELFDQQAPAGSVDKVAETEAKALNTAADVAEDVLEVEQYLDKIPDGQVALTSKQEAQIDAMESKLMEDSAKLGEQTADAAIEVIVPALTEATNELLKEPTSEADMKQMQEDFTLMNQMLDSLDSELSQAIKQSTKTMGVSDDVDQIMRELAKTIDQIQKVPEEPLAPITTSDPLAGLFDGLFGPMPAPMFEFQVPDFELDYEDFNPPISKDVCRRKSVIKCMVRLSTYNTKALDTVCEGKGLDSCVDELMRDSDPHVVHKKKVIKKHHKSHKKHHKHHNEAVVKAKGLPHYPCEGKSVSYCYKYVRKNKDAYCGNLSTMKCVYNVKMDEPYDSEHTYREHIRDYCHRHRVLIISSLVFSFLLVFALVSLCIRSCVRSANRRKRERYSMVPGREQYNDPEKYKGGSEDSKYLLGSKNN